MRGTRAPDLTWAWATGVWHEVNVCLVVHLKPGESHHPCTTTTTTTTNSLEPHQFPLSRARLPFDLSSMHPASIQVTRHLCFTQTACGDAALRRAKISAPCGERLLLTNAALGHDSKLSCSCRRLIRLEGLLYKLTVSFFRSLEPILVHRHVAHCVPCRYPVRHFRGQIRNYWSIIRRCSTIQNNSLLFLLMPTRHYPSLPFLRVTQHPALAYTKPYQKFTISPRPALPRYISINTSPHPPKHNFIPL